IVGFIAMISDGIYLDIMGRFGYNLTNNTWGKADDMEVDVDSAYDIAVYLGIGLKTFQTGL
ncbi:MAG: hypothetical protein N2316_08195, partial [Spirochaetes bacterium]|nr:hypothetical protein [Spirochaetota bacterium]